MADSITQDPVSFISSDGKTQIHGYIWRDTDKEPRGIVQLVHGMAEHINRYDDFARFLAQNGFVVGGIDHLGHGDSISDEVKPGGLDPHDGANHLIEDVHRMRSLILARTPHDLPYFIFGHSMGSFVTRNYITRYAQDLTGVIICGTGHIAPVISRAGNLIARFVAATRGKNHKSKLLDKMGAGGFNSSVENPRTDVDWIAFDETTVNNYLADEKCGFMFPAGGYASLTALTKMACSTENIRKIPHDLPLLFVAGAKDPVGDMGKGVRHTADMARDAGVEDIEVRIYDGMRHEILNEVDHQHVYDDILAWLNEHMDEEGK